MISIAIGAILFFPQNAAVELITNTSPVLENMSQVASQHDCNRNAFCRNGFKSNFCK